MENLLPALILPLVIALMVWLGLRSRKSAIAGYEDDKQRYTATATMTVTDIRQEDVERWEEQGGRHQPPDAICGLSAHL